MNIISAQVVLAAANNDVDFPVVGDNHYNVENHTNYYRNGGYYPGNIDSFERPDEMELSPEKANNPFSFVELDEKPKMFDLKYMVENILITYPRG